MARYGKRYRTPANSPARTFAKAGFPESQPPMIPGIRAIAASPHTSTQINSFKNNGLS
jgi:hypothetical protein